MLKLIGNVSSALLLAAVCALGAALVVVPKATGAKPLTVLTGSMSGTYDPGSVVVVRPVRAEQLRVGDTVTYQLRSDDPMLVTHRVVGIGFRPDGTRQLTTQGDASGSPDPAPVMAAQVRGTVWYSVPLVGYASTALSPQRREPLVKVAAAGLVLWSGYLFLGALRERRRKVAAVAP